MGAACAQGKYLPLLTDLPLRTRDVVKGGRPLSIRISKHHSKHSRVMIATGLLVLSWCGVCRADWPNAQYAWSNRPQSLSADPAAFYLPRRLPPVNQFGGPSGETFFGRSLAIGQPPRPRSLSQSDTAGPIFSPPGPVVYEPTYRPLDQLTLERPDPIAPLEEHGPAEFEEESPGRFRSMFGGMGRSIGQDYRNYYTSSTLLDLSLAVALAAPVANTSLDGDFGNWYQQSMRSSGTDDFAGFWKTFGEGQLFMPAFAGLWLAGEILENSPVMGTLGSFGGRATRAYVVGAPPMLFMQFFLGGGRPGEHSVDAQWRPFSDSNAVSGHAFMGAVPFITAAKKTDDPWAKGTLYACSTLTAWSRVNDDDHYITQACLGWWMAYLACRAVDDTDRSQRNFEVMPLVTPEMSGVGVTYRM